MTPKSAIKKAKKIYEEDFGDDPQKSLAILAIAKFLAGEKDS
jgi:hypothetical protein